MNYEEIVPLINNVMADNMLLFCVRHGTLDRLLAVLETEVRVRDPQTDTPKYVRVRDLTRHHVRLY